jgi:hypothetical protein
MNKEIFDLEAVKKAVANLSLVNRPGTWYFDTYDVRDLKLIMSFVNSNLPKTEKWVLRYHTPKGRQGVQDRDVH